MWIPQPRSRQRTLVNECVECEAEEGSPEGTRHHGYKHRQLLVPIVQRLALNQLFDLS